MRELFKDIPGYEGLYQVSNLGNIKTLNYKRTGKERILSPVKNVHGYLVVNLYKNGKQKKFTIHRFVAQAFLDNPDNLPMVNHKNEIKTDNRSINLEWCDNQYNVRYSSAKKVGCFKDSKLIKVYDCIQDVKLDGFNQGNVCNALKGRYKSTGGYQWKYLD